MYYTSDCKIFWVYLFGNWKKLKKLNPPPVKMQSWIRGWLVYKIHLLMICIYISEDDNTYARITIIDRHMVEGTYNLQDKIYWKYDRITNNIDSHLKESCDLVCINKIYWWDVFIICYLLKITMFCQIY